MQKDAAPHQIGTDAQMLTDSILLLCRKGRVHALLLPLAVDFPHGIFRHFGEDHLSSVMLLRCYGK